jgi:hypothetical protein
VRDFIGVAQVDSSASMQGDFFFTNKFVRDLSNIYFFRSYVFHSILENTYNVCTPTKFIKKTKFKYLTNDTNYIS